MNLNPLTQINLFEHKEIFNQLTKLYKNDTLPNKILLSGEKGIGKSTLSYHLINFVLSENEDHPYDSENNKINFENSIIEDDKTLEYFDHSFVEKIRKHFNIDIFDNAFRNLILNGNSINKKKYLQQRGKVSDMVHERKFTVKENLWNDYQKTEKNSAAWRIEKLNLRKYASKDKTLLDLGANHGEFCLSLSDDFRHVTAVEPFVEAPEMPLNMTWIKNGFKEFIEDSDQTYDVVFSFAMTIQVRDMQGLEENEIAKGHYKLVSPDGIMIYETQKLEDREINQEHVQRMLASFRNYFGNEIESGEARNSGKRRYYVFKKEA